MTILALQYRPEELLGKAIGTTLLIFKDRDGDNQFDPDEMVSMGSTSEEIRAIGAIGRWDGLRIVWPGSTTTVDPRVAMLEAQKADTKAKLQAIVNGL